MINFKNEECESGTGLNGTCYSESDCTNLGGTGSGSCASGFGVCCLITQTCGGSTDKNNTYFQNKVPHTNYITLKQWFLNWGNLPSEGKLSFLGG